MGRARLPGSGRTDYYDGSMGSYGARAYAEVVIAYGAETKDAARNKGRQPVPGDCVKAGPTEVEKSPGR